MEWNELSQEKDAMSSFRKCVIYMFHMRQRISEEISEHQLLKEYLLSFVLIQE
jgi:hypothetical protein